MQVLRKGACEVYEVEQLNYNEDLALFHSNSLGNNSPTTVYIGMSKQMVAYVNGLPLAIKVFNSFLYSKSKEEWKSALNKLPMVPIMEIQNVLNLSYKGLDDREKDIFLDIAYNEICMRILLKEMGQEIIRQESVNEPGNGSRLCIAETVPVKGIFLDMLKLDIELYLSPGAFLEIYFRWDGYRFKLLPSNFLPRNLVECHMRNSQVKQLWSGVQLLICIVSSKTKWKQYGELIYKYQASFSPISPRLNRMQETLNLLPERPPFLELLEADDCISLETVSSSRTELTQGWSRYNLPREEFKYCNCLKLDQTARTNVMADAQLRILHLCIYGFYARASISICHSGNQIPEWFNYQAVGSLIKIKLPRGWYNSSFLGFAVSAFVGFLCYDCDFGLNLVKERDDACWPTSFFYDVSEFEFESYPTNYGDHLDVKKCRIQLLYAQDGEKITRCGMLPKV
ncbi:disease resistance protein RPP2B-like [Ziziphus jujuba]|uniref:Disease resistance protein RPP2B-like n=1 Tax=Ziziphus jujuba TaxID=326968 RepID=A0ABM3ZUK7_ZIZJJ|nr:disease resistance protein RPP2B-like [Ziziphus jujuba]